MLCITSNVFCIEFLPVDTPLKHLYPSLCMKLVIVESPTKAKTLSKFLPKEYEIKASKGHVRDLPKSGLGVDVEHDFKPEYIVPEKAKKVITDLKKSVKTANSIALATDPDREGEAIAWHLQELLSKKDNKDKFLRISFHELTKEAVDAAFEHPQKLDMHLVDAQQARRVLDRLVGYKLSPLLWKKVRYGLSAGRVQSVAVRLVVEKERERDAFVPQEYWSIDGLFADGSKEVLAALVEKDSEKLEISSEKQASKIKKDLDADTFTLTSIKKSERKRNPSPPFKTSTLQQTAANVFGFSAKKTMQAAQKLFENGHITYHRTDSLNLSPGFVSDVRVFIEKEFGSKYMPDTAIFYKSTAKGAQEAHEAIRPTNIRVVPGHVKGLKGDEHKLYSLVWKRAVECQMLPAIYDQTTLLIGSGGGYGFKATGSVIKFPGWLTVADFLGWEASADDLLELPSFKEGAALRLENVNMEQHFTQPPARYSDATLIKTLEELGIGRPSTYAPTLSTIQARGYVTKEGKYFLPTDVAYVVVDLLVVHFPEIVDYDFTAKMEEDLDEVAEEGKNWVAIVKEFYKPFEKLLKVKDKELQKSEVTNLGESKEKCPECSKILIIKLGKYGKFLSCSGYPECDYAQPMEEDKVLDENGKEITDFGKCEECDGDLVLKRGRYGKFLACSNYPNCKFTKPFLEKIGMKCPKCEEGDVVVKKAKGRTFYGCSRYPDCDYSSWKNPKDVVTTIIAD